MEVNNIVKNDSQGYGYKYASLSDIALQGFNIPKMKTGTENGKDYIFWFDTEMKEWFRGAEIVIPDGKNMNKAQQYASALTYAKRQTILMADCLATDDDIEIEKEVLFDEPSEADIKSLADEFRKLYSKEDQARILNGLHLLKAEDIGFADLQKYVNFKKYGNDKK